MLSDPSETGYVVDVTWNNADVNIDGILFKEFDNGQFTYFGSYMFYDTTKRTERFEWSKNLADGPYYLEIERSSGPVDRDLEVSISITHPKNSNSSIIKREPLHIITMEAGYSNDIQNVIKFEVKNGEFIFTPIQEVK